MNITTTVLKQTTTTSARMSTSIHRTELSTLGSINFDKLNSENLCASTDQLRIGQQYQLQTNNNKQTANHNKQKPIEGSQNGGILMESKRYSNVVKRNSDKNRRHTITVPDVRLLKILSVPSDEPLFINDSPNNQQHKNVDADKVDGANFLMQYEAATSSIVDGVVAADDYENQPPSDDKCTMDNHEDENMPLTPQRYFSSATWGKIQRDLNSPSALCHQRARAAITNPTNSYYYNKSDDPQNAEKSMETALSDFPKTIQEVMQNVCVYVEVRSATENRTDGIKKTIASMGAKVNDRISKNTTHVVFRDGLQSTYDKAKSLNIPIVSILWIEACRKHLVLMNPKDYQIQNAEVYENPYLYGDGKTKRQKYIQPDKLMKNLHRKIPKSKLLQGLKKMDESNNSSVLSSSVVTAKANTSNSTTSKIPQVKKVTAATKVNTSRKSLSLNCDTKPKNTIRSMFEKQVEKSRIENSQENIEESVINATITDAPTAASTSTTVKVSETEKSASPSVELGAVNNDANLNSNKSPVSETTLMTGTLHSRLTRRNSITITTPTKATPNKSRIDANVSATLGSARKRRTMFTPSIKTTLEEPDQSFGKDIPTTTQNKTIISEVSMDICAPKEKEKETPKCNNQVRQLLDVHLANSINDVSKTRSTLRRRTVYTPQPMDESEMYSRPITPARSQRKTINPYLKSTKKSSPKIDNPPDVMETQSCDAILTPTNPIGKKISASSIHNSSLSSLVTTPSIKSMSQIHLNRAHLSTQKTVLDEYNNSFSSKKTPLVGNRRSIANITMDIIKQRVENINRNTPVNNSLVNEDIIASKALQQQIQYNPSNDTPTQSAKEVPTETNKTKPIGRKLFAHPSLFPGNSPLTVATPPKTDKKTAIKSATKRKRNELFDDKLPKTAAEEKKTRKPQQSRRSTLFFEEAPIKNGHSNTIPTDSTLEKVVNDSVPVLVYTSMHQPQIDFINEAVKKLGKYKIEAKVSSKTTHLIAFDTRRTINMLRGLIRGIWILNYDWIQKSFEANEWQSESDYEMKSFSKAVEVNRIERQAFGKKYRMDIFRNFKLIYISSDCACKNLKELITLCYGKVTSHLDQATYIISELYHTAIDNQNTLQLHPNWILDSISAGKAVKLEKYILSSC